MVLLKAQAGATKLGILNHLRATTPMAIETKLYATDQTSRSRERLPETYPRPRLTDDGEIAGKGVRVHLRAHVDNEEGGLKQLHAESADVLRARVLDELEVACDHPITDGEQDGDGALEGADERREDAVLHRAGVQRHREGVNGSSG